MTLRPLRDSWRGPCIVAATFLVLTAWTWRKWPDILVDFGRELYVPWQLVSGKVLYIDIAYFNGPLSPYLNALWFRLFGVSVTTLAVCNLAILAVTTALLFRLLAIACDRFTATASCCIFLFVFGFAQLTETGNYNFLAPYSHELTHGLALSVGMILCLSQYSLTRKRRWAALAGLLFGLTFLTKPEVFVAAAAAVAVAIFTERKGIRGGALPFLGAAIVPIAAALAALSAHMPVGTALRSVAGTSLFLTNTDIVSSIFYKRNMGLDAPGARLSIMVRAFLGVAMIAGAVAAADAARKLQRRMQIGAFVASLLLVIGSCVIRLGTDPFQSSPWFPVPWVLLGASLTLTTLAAGAYALRAGNVLLLMWTVFALATLAKIWLAPRVYHYGFVLAMPATLVLIGGLLHFIPQALKKSGGGGDLFRRMALTLLIADSIFFLKISNNYYRNKSVVVGTGGDAIFTSENKIDPRGAVVAKVLERIDVLMPPNATLVVLPEGVMLNYLSRRTNPTRFLSSLDAPLFGEEMIRASIQAHPPDFILLTPKDMSEYGADPFDVDPRFGRQILQWVDSNYSMVEDVAAEPPTTKDFDIKIFKRNSP